MLLGTKAIKGRVSVTVTLQGGGYPYGGGIALDTSRIDQRYEALKEQ